MGNIAPDIFYLIVASTIMVGLLTLWESGSGQVLRVKEGSYEGLYSLAKILQQPPTN